ncbi:MAG: PhoH family protein [Bacteroidales bacterium]|jgi:phosphate starvation-inducible PhoH-like protein|nr:PhoH family protein [Bacteroidales bacterium]
MTEHIILLETLNPLDIFGVNNEKIDAIRKYFPKLKIIARGNELKVIGSRKEFEHFEEQMQHIFVHVQKYHGIQLAVIHDMLRGNQKNESLFDNENPNNDVLFYGNNGKPIKARTPNQKKLVALNDKNDILFAIGPAGTGKTYTAVALAVRALRNKEVERIILCRPAVEADEKLGFLPGDMREKLNPYLQPLYDALQAMMPPKKLQDLINENVIQISPLAYMRGRTLDNAFVILDEAQNATLNQLKMFLTRMGERAKFIITGDITQIDLPEKSRSGLQTVLSLFKNSKGIESIQFENKDIVRHRLVSHIIDAFDSLHKE